MPKSAAGVRAPNSRLSTLNRLEQLLAVHNHEVSPWRIFKIMAEFVMGFEFLNRYQTEKAVTFFGSARTSNTDPVYKEAVKLSHKLASAGFTVITGGGPGIMEAANKGAFEAGGKSLGINIKLPHEQRTNPYVTESESFQYFFTRKVMMSFASEIYIFFPGGFGTLDELFELVTLVQTGKIGRVPIILVHKPFWQPLLAWIEKTLYVQYKNVGANDMQLYYLAEDAEDAFGYIKSLQRNKKIISNEYAKYAV